MRSAPNTLECRGNVCSHFTLNKPPQIDNPYIGLDIRLDRLLAICPTPTSEAAKVLTELGGWVDYDEKQRQKMFCLFASLQK